MSFQPRIRSAGETSPGKICCSSPVAAHRCPKCQPAAMEMALRTNIEDTVKHDYSAPNPYPSLSARGAANATPASTFAEKYKADRLREINAEHDAWAAKWAAEPKPRRLTAAEQARYEPPNPYASLKETR